MRALLVVRGVAVEVQRLPPEAFDLALDLVDVGHALPSIEVHAADVVAGLSQRQRRRLAEAAARAQDQRPWLAVVGGIFGTRRESRRRV